MGSIHSAAGLRSHVPLRSTVVWGVRSVQDWGQLYDVRYGMSLGSALWILVCEDCALWLSVDISDVR